MCELFALSSLLPTRVSFSMAEFSQHGGLTGRHKDGWGIAFYAENDVQIIRETIPAFDSEILFVHGHKRTQKNNRGILPPGLFTLCRTCSAEGKRTKIKGIDLDFEGEKQEVLLAASVPLTKENWIPLAEGEIQAISKGRVLEVVKAN